MSADSTSPLSRRVFVRNAALAMATIPTALVAGLSTSGCADADEGDSPAAKAVSSNADRAHSVGRSSSIGDAGASSAAGGDGANSDKVLVAYFSATGHTRGVAEVVARELGADTFAISPSIPYTSDDLNYNDPESRVMVERDDEDRHVEIQLATPEGFADYDTIFIGAPTWSHAPSWVIDDFLTGNDFTGKRLYYFTTSGGSPLGSSLDVLAGMAPSGTWVDGSRFPSNFDEADVIEWLDGLGL